MYRYLTIALLDRAVGVLLPLRGSEVKRAGAVVTGAKIGKHVRSRASETYG